MLSLIKIEQTPVDVSYGLRHFQSAVSINISLLPQLQASSISDLQITKFNEAKYISV